MFSEAVLELFLHSLTTKWLAGRQGPKAGRAIWHTVCPWCVLTHTHMHTQYSILYTLGHAENYLEASQLSSVDAAFVIWVVGAA